MNNIEDIKSKIESLSKIKEESYRTILQLNISISENTTSRDIEIKRKDNLQKNIDKLYAKIHEIKKSEKQSDK